MHKRCISWWTGELKNNGFAYLFKQENSLVLNAESNPNVNHPVSPLPVTTLSTSQVHQFQCMGRVQFSLKTINSQSVSGCYHLCYCCCWMQWRVWEKSSMLIQRSHFVQNKFAVLQTRILYCSLQGSCSIWYNNLAALVQGSCKL